MSEIPFLNHFLLVFMHVTVAWFWYSVIIVSVCEIENESKDMIHSFEQMETREFHLLIDRVNNQDYYCISQCKNLSTSTKRKIPLMLFALLSHSFGKKLRCYSLACRFRYKSIFDYSSWYYHNNKDDNGDWRLLNLFVLKIIHISDVSLLHSWDVNFFPFRDIFFLLQGITIDKMNCANRDVYKNYITLDETSFNSTQ